MWERRSAIGKGAMWSHQSDLNPLKVVQYLLLGDALGLVLVDALGFLLVNALGVVLVDTQHHTLVVCNPSCNKLKKYSSINLSIAV